MPRRTTQKRRGARTTYTEHRANIITTAVQNGHHITTACNLANVGHSTLYTWLNRANEVEEALNNGTEYPIEWHPLLDFRDRLAVARADAEVFMVDVVRKDVAGGQVTSEEPVVNDRGEAQYDENGDVLWKRTYSQTNGRLALAYLAKASPDKWGDKSRIEILTPDNNPVGPDDDGLGGGVGSSGEGIAAALELAKRLALTARQRESGHDDVDEPVMGEIVEDGS